MTICVGDPVRHRSTLGREAENLMLVGWQRDISAISKLCHERVLNQMRYVNARMLS
jgi:hypothetical protein